MKRAINYAALAAIALIAGLAVLNWSTLMASAPINLLIIQIDAPLGVVMLGVTAVVAGLFFVAYLRNQVSALMETRKLLQEVQRVQGLADKAESSRIENLHQLISTEFRQLNERLNKIEAASHETTHARENREHDESRPLSLGEIMTRGEG